eukprot:TRINITY_DN90244_c0_g1_i1.p1 TRINITY_DN90244_c0_g1~~TRINITY_DN90244_c0_g1_i1.p1  ORF type:complete len:283 (-),score=55.70 TRINITY_DN90244_c0_g1_i1:187-981(-)
MVVGFSRGPACATQSQLRHPCRWTKLLLAVALVLAVGGPRSARFVGTWRSARGAPHHHQGAAASAAAAGSSWSRRPLASVVREASLADAELVKSYENRALAASESWEEDVTEFLEPDVIAAVEKRLSGLADIAAVKVGGYANAERARLVLTRPELVEATGADEIAKQHAVLVRLVAELSGEDPLPNVLGDIGIDLEQIGDVLLDEDGAWVVLHPDAVKAADRLLKRALNVQVDVIQMEPGSEPQGQLQEVVLRRLDKRGKKKTR